MNESEARRMARRAYRPFPNHKPKEKPMPEKEQKPFDRHIDFHTHTYTCGHTVDHFARPSHPCVLMLKFIHKCPQCERKDKSKSV